MDPRIAPLTLFAETVAAGRPDRFEQAVKAAYAAGASREELLAAVEVGRRLAQVPGPVLTQAYAAVHAWHWIVARQAAREPMFASHAA